MSIQSFIDSLNYSPPKPDADQAKLAFKELKNTPDVFSLISALRLIQQKNYWDLLPTNFLTEYIEQHPDNTMVHSVVQQLFSQAIKYLGNENLFEKCTGLIPKYKQLIQSGASQIYDPKIVCTLIENGVHSNQYQWDILINLAAARGDLDTKDYLTKEALRNGHTPRILDAIKPSTSFLINEFENDRIESGGYRAYSSQEAYREQQNRTADLLRISMALERFNIIPSNFTRKQWENVSYATKREFSKDHPDAISLLHLGNIRFSIYEINQMLIDPYPNHPSERLGFGILRDLTNPIDRIGNETRWQTRFGIQYAKYKDKILRAYEADKKSFSVEKLTEVDGVKLPTIQIWGDISGKKIPLTKIEGGFIHTEGKYLPEILAHCQNLLNALTKRNIDITSHKEVEQLLKKVGELHWWLSHAMPFERGSASISEMVVMGICKHHGLSISWNTSLDCEALINPSVEEYQEKYVHMITVNNPEFVLNEAEKLVESVKQCRDEVLSEKKGYNNLLASLHKSLNSGATQEKIFTIILKEFKTEYDSKVNAKFLFGKSMNPQKFIDLVTKQQDKNHYTRMLADIISNTNIDKNKFPKYKNVIQAANDIAANKDHSVDLKFKI